MNMQTYTLAEIEAALDSGRMNARMQSGKCWQLRRNGQTKTWKTRPGEYRIPVKAGLRSTGYIEHTSLIGTNESKYEFVIQPLTLLMEGKE